MIQWEETGTGIRALDHANVEVTVRAPDWRTADAGAGLPRPTDEVVHGVASELRFPSAYVSVEGQQGTRRVELGNDTGPLRLARDDYLVDLDAGLKTYLRFDGDATVSKTPDFETVVVEFPERRPVTLGFRSRHNRPVGTITVPPSPEGIATGLSHLHSSLKTTSPDRSFPTLRGHPPRLATGDQTAVPDVVADDTTETGIELRSPPDLATLYVLAPLAYYLQASVEVADVATPVLSAPAADVSLTLPGVPELQAETAATLRHHFFLDALVRNIGPHGTDLAEAAVLDELDFDPAWAYEASPDERFAAYESIPRGAIDDHVPEWHLSTYVTPDATHARNLPFLLDKMSLVYLPQTSELSGSELLERSLDDFYRVDDKVASVDVVKPDLQHGRIHAWLADGIPIDVFKATHAAFENRLDYLERGGDGIEVAVVLNDEDMEGEHDDVGRIYRERAEDLPMEVTVHEYLDRDELAAVFEAENDFVHYIGHCEESGLQCADGTLGMVDVRESNARTFFLNACGSYYQGMKLLEKGSVAGAVTFKEVLDRQAAKVGTTFARLLVHGFSFARAMKLARRRIMTGKDYAVIGDGTYALTQSDIVMPNEMSITEDGGEFDLEVNVYAAWTTGAVYHITYVGEDERESHLCGNESCYHLAREELLEYLDQSSSPVIYDGAFYWSSEVRDLLG